MNAYTAKDTLSHCQGSVAYYLEDNTQAKQATIQKLTVARLSDMKN